MGLFTRIIKGLQDVFPSSQRTISHPTVLDETVYPVVLFPGPLARFLELVAEDFVGIAGDDQVASSITPADRVRHLIYCDAFHNDAVSNQDLEFALSGPAFITPITIAQSAAQGGFQSAAFQFVPINTPYSLNNTMPRGIMIPPGWRIQVNARPGITAPAVVNLRIRYIDYPLADLPHW